MNGAGVRKNYGGRMIFGDEKLTPLRSVPRYALAYGSGRLTGGYLASGVAPPTPNFAPCGRKLQIPAGRYTQYDYICLYKLSGIDIFDFFLQSGSFRLVDIILRPRR